MRMKLTHPVSSYLLLTLGMNIMSIKSAPQLSAAMSFPLIGTLLNVKSFQHPSGNITKHASYYSLANTRKVLSYTARNNTEQLPSIIQATQSNDATYMSKVNCSV